MIWNLSSLIKTRKEIKGENYNILEKEGESIWFLKNNRVIKYSKDPEFIKLRVKRQKILNSFTPKIIDYSKHFYVYQKINGKIFSKVMTNKLFRNLLNHLRVFWKKKKVDQKKFEYRCLKFYKDKTYERIKLFKNKYKNYDRKEFINGKKVELVYNLLSKTNWKNLSNGKSVNFHGDLHFENIIFSKKKFIFLDWRQNFSGYLNNGDIYYDLAKIMHGILVSHKKSN